MAAIRWDNIDAPNFNGVAAIMEAAGKSMNTGLNALQTPVTEANAMGERNWQAQDATSRAEALSKIMSFTDPVELEKAKANGLYEQLVGDGMSAASKMAVMGGLDSRGPLLENRGVARINYENALADNAQQGTLQSGYLALLNGDIEGVKKAAAGLRNPAALVTAGISQQHYADQQKQVQAAFELKKALTDAQIGLLGAKAGDPDNFTENGGGKGSGGSGGKAGNKPELSEEEAAQRNLDQLELKDNIYATPHSLDVSAKFAKEHLKDDGVRTGVLAGLSALDSRGYRTGTGDYIPYPQAVIQQAMLETSNTYFPGWNTASVMQRKVKEIMDRPGVQEAIITGKGLRETLATDPVSQQKVANDAKMKILRQVTQGGGNPDGVALFMNSGRVRDFATGGYRDAAPVDPRTAPAANQVPVVPVQAAPAGLTYAQLMGGTDPKKGMSANPPISTPLISKEDKPSASVGLSLGASGSITGVHPDAVKIPEVDWSEPKMIQKAAPGAIPKGGGERAVVTFVEDGDTAKLLRGDGSQIKCRIDKIDAPETAHEFAGKPGQAYGNEARKTLQDMIDNKEVTLKITRPADKGNRFGCQIEVEGANVDLAMVQAGAAWLYRRYANDPNLVKAEQEARTAKRGLWADPNPVNPEAFRRSLEKAREGR